MCRLNIFKLNGFVIFIILHFSLLSTFNFNFGTAFIHQEQEIKISSISLNTPTVYTKPKDLIHIMEGDQNIVNKFSRNQNKNKIFNTIYNLINPQKLIDDELTGANVTIAVLDSGINDVEWITNLAARYTTISDSINVEDDNGHGTFIGSIISKIASGAELISIKVTDSSGFTSIESVEEGLKLAFDLNVTIIHASLGSIHLDALNSSLIAQINSHNITTVFSAGNSGPFTSSLSSPAIFAETIAVGMAYNKTHIFTSTSCGPRPSGTMGPDIVAPGVDIIGQNQTGDFKYRTGTSYAAAFVSGALALLKEAFPEKSPLTLKAALLETAHFMNSTSPITQGNGFLDVSKAYELLQTINTSNPLFSFAPRELSSYFTYFGHAINGENRTYRLTFYSTTETNLTKFNTTQSFPVKTNTSRELPINITIGTLPKKVTVGINYLNLSLKIPEDLSMAKREGYVTFQFSNGTYLSNLSITIENRYPGGNILFYQGYDNDSYIPDGPTGKYSLLQQLLERSYGMNSYGAIRPTSLINTYGPLVLTKQSSGKITGQDLKGYHILVLADIEFGISDHEISTIQDWIAEGHSLLILSYPSLENKGIETLSNQTAINKLLEPYGLSIENDNTNLSRFNNASTSISDPIFRRKGLKFNYTGTSIGISTDKGGKALATAFDPKNKEYPVAGYWEDPVSRGKVVVFGGTLPFNNLGINPHLNNLEVINHTFRWMIADQQLQLDILLTSSPTTQGSTQIQITVEDTELEPFNGTVIEANGSFNQITFDKGINMYIASWKPLAAGKAILWLNLRIENTDEAPTNGLFVFEVIRPASQDIFFLVIIGGFIVLGIIYYLLASRRPQPRSPIEQRVALELQKQKNGIPQGGLETSEICPQCRTPRHTNESKYCFKCGKEL
ncbi:MAG: S8 family serine peptidase [Candidatus Heimdallarchaeota archaeon]|nr:MAG: S8 family serine peptidase [Candidatus Heimdallarchaeota archaeon]